MSILLVVFIVLAVFLIVLAGGLFFFLWRPLPRTRGTVHLPGLQSSVQVLRDRWGVPHIYAQNAEDLFYAQGYVHAQDRLWQMELQRRLTAGRLSEIFGETTLPVDRFLRVVGLYRAAEEGVEALDDESRRALRAYAAGVNAYISSRRGRWSLEFGLLRFEPDPWQLADSLCWLKMMAWNMGCNWASELIRARLAASLGAELAADLEPPYPAHNPAVVHGPGLPAGAEPPPNGWGSETLRQSLQQVADLLAGPPPPPPEAAPPGLAQPAGNSNQWVVSGKRSASGRPLLSNDTHLLLQLPTAWYQVHLCGGGYHVTGASLPGLPGVAVGHNEHCAWGITIAWQDAQDLYVERLHPDDGHRYEFEGQWLTADVLQEEIGVKGREAPVRQEVVVTRHGPILSKVLGEETPLALRWVALERDNPLRAVLRLARARNWDEFRAAMDGWSAPSMNFVYADVEGNIGFVQAGCVPVRTRGYGLVPAPGWTGEYEWQGYLSLDELPQAFNPESGWLGTANHLVVDEAYPHYLSSDLENPARARRIADLVGRGEGLTMDDFARFQLDTLSLHAERFLPYLLAVRPRTERERRALDYLAAWDCRMEADSVAASIARVCRLRTLRLVFDPHLGPLADAYVGLSVTPLGENSPYHDRSVVRLLDLLDGQGSDYWLRDPETGQLRDRAEILHQALQEALALLQARLGPDMERWTWGRLNRFHFDHPVGSVKPLHLLFNRGPYPASGDGDTLLRAAGQPEFPFEPAAVGDAVRFIADPGDWEACRIVMPGGQSGHVASRHYADLIPLWRQGRFQPMPFARDDVERHSRERLTLLPAAAP